jgi:WD40 repeat protein
LTLWDLDTEQSMAGPRLAADLLGKPYRLLFSGDGRRLIGQSFEWARGGEAWGRAVGRITVWDVSGDRGVAVLSEIEYRTNAATVFPAVSPDGRHFAAFLNLSVASVIDLDNGRVRLSLRGHSRNVHHLSFSADGRRLLSVGAKAFTAPTEREANKAEGKVWDVETGQELLAVPLETVGYGLRSEALFFDGRRLLEIVEGRLRILDGTP